MLLTDLQRDWVEDGIARLKEQYTGPFPVMPIVRYDRTFFPQSKQVEHPPVEWLLDDLCPLLHLEREEMSHVFVKSLWQIPNASMAWRTAKETSGLTYRVDEHGHLHFSVYLHNWIKEHSHQLLKRCILELCAARIIASDLDMDLEGPDRWQVAELMAVHLGFGRILAQARNEITMKVEGGWRTSWRFPSPLPQGAFAYALLLHARLHHIPESNLLKELPTEIVADVREVQKAHVPKQHSLEPLVALSAADFARAMRMAQDHRERWELPQALRIMQEIAPLAPSSNERALLHNNMGYTLTLLGRHEEAVAAFQLALRSVPSYAYAHDNLGFVLILSGDLDGGFRELQNALATGRNHSSYSHRNLAVYHWMRGEQDQARYAFQEALSGSDHVDLLDALFGRFLRTHGENGMAEVYEERAQLRGAPLFQWIEHLGA